MIRNLLYTCAATTHSEEWRLNVERLCRYASAFNGRKLISSRTGEGIHPPEVIEKAFAPLGSDVEFEHVPNDIYQAETVGFMDLLKRLESDNPNEITFHAQTRGTRYKMLAEPFMESIRRWRNTAYDECLKDIPNIEKVLSKAACCGCFMERKPLVGTGKWYFWGSYWWVNHKALFTRLGWDQLPRKDYLAVEGYLGSLFTVDEAKCLYGLDPPDLYAAEMEFRCETDGCGNQFKKVMKRWATLPEICAKCRKRRAVSVDGITELPKEGYPYAK